MKPIKIAQVGTWHDHAFPTYKSITALNNVYDFVGLAEPGESICQSFRDEQNILSVDELLNMNDLDAVAIECEEENATHYAKIFAEKGIAIHLDKPGTQDPQTFAELIKIVKDNNLPFQMGYMYRYNPMIMRCMDDIKQGKLGKIFSIEAQMSVCHDLEKRKWLGNYKGGMMYFLGCHLLDLILQIQGNPKKITVFNTSTEKELLNNAEDFGFVVLDYDYGSSFIKVCACETNGFERRQFVVAGTEGTIEIKPFETKISINDSELVSKAHITYKSDVTDIWRDNSTEIISEGYDRYNPMMMDFAAYIHGKKKNPYTYDYELKLFNLLLKCCGM